MKILHVPTDVGNQGYSLSLAERTMGYESLCVVMMPGNHIGYKADLVIRTKENVSGILKRDLWQQWNIFFMAHRFDVIHYNFGRSIFPNPSMVGAKYRRRLSRLYAIYALSWGMIDVWWLKRIMKKYITVTFQGGDARQGNRLKKLYPEWNDTNEEPPWYYDPLLDRIKAIRIRLWDRWADEIYYLNPDLGHVLPARAKFLPYAIGDMR